MIYGRIRPPRIEPRATFNTFPLRDRAFAYRILAGLGVGLLGCFLLFLVPAVFFIEQNYEIFTALAYDVKPGLVEHLEREIIWLRFFLGTAAFATAAVGVLFVRRIVRHLLKPLEDIEDHLRALSQGQWHHPMPGAPSSETYRTFFISYDNFQRSLKLQAENELRLLQKISVDPNQRDAQMAWQALLAMQKSKLGLTEEQLTESAAESSAVVPFRRVS
ncbi:MAG: hypothetical protein KF789_01655 [Bdellovibrionaceae bacterium]|nr:hypothetical protein [Pseudobdellovibrionaceae bacterium]